MVVAVRPVGSATVRRVQAVAMFRASSGVVVKLVPPLVLRYTLSESAPEVLR